MTYMFILKCALKLVLKNILTNTRLLCFLRKFRSILANMEGRGDCYADRNFGTASA